jgi:hypothetical protein
MEEALDYHSAAHQEALPVQMRAKPTPEFVIFYHVANQAYQLQWEDYHI